MVYLIAAVEDLMCIDRGLNFVGYFLVFRYVPIKATKALFFQIDV